MPIRRSHRKSRHGCTACKQRRVKCDEVRPVCSNCKQREEDCNYVSAASYLWASEKKPRTRTRKRKQPPSKDVEQTSSPPSDAPFSLLDRCDHTPPISHPAPPPLDITQLRLLVNWQKNTCCFFSRDEDTRIVWQVFLVDEALESPSLMHGILAVSALHLALSEPASEQSFWFGLATAYKGEALYALRHNLTEMTPEKAKFMMGLSALAVVYAFGSVLTDVDDVQPGLDALNNVFILCRGVQQITGQAHSYLQQSNFAPLFNPGEPTVAVPDHVQQSLDHLDYLNTEYNEDDNDTATYSQVITAMRSLSAHAFAQPNSMTLAAGWAIRVPSQYLEYLQLQRPFALVIHAHYCAFLHLARGNCFFKNWGHSVLRDILKLLDHSWIPHIQWPICEIFGDGYLDELYSGQAHTPDFKI
ncbi:Zn(II)2Cys6 transcription factor [Penicillium brevicompactum]|uniref:Zn(II)2Cys6 transcription factor n=1 Tax=Penicillium brevicompactum TaxID=5074 RepID=UPI00253F72E4|nr:Zn(II)2Cys6 transcription factor [Penicillium brevicompactum]KAJ5326774.1 Zn(II)2Cys6 transcription factor [Penicillium brevicompactum]